MISTRVVRPFEASDAEYAALARLQTGVYPEYPFSAAEIRHEDATWDHSRYLLRRWVLELDGGLAGWVQLQHSRHSFVAHTYWLDLGVAPDARRRGHGTALYEHALGVLRDRAARLVRCNAKESMREGVDFLVHRGFSESRREWESRLRLRDFDPTRFAGARERAELHGGIRIATLAQELARDADGAARQAFEVAEEAHQDIPGSDAPTPGDFETFRRRDLAGPNAMLDAYFVAVTPEGRIVGLSQLQRADDPTFLWQGLTGLRREARGKGIAMALKLEAVRYAQERGYDHIKTWNDAANRPMLRINEALGFEKQPAWIEFARPL